jgi:Flp pilus assembly protein TadG
MAGLDFTGFFRSARRFKRASEAIAAVEFALILPFLLVLYMGTVEISLAITADRRVGIVAGSVGDLVAQSDDVVAIATLNDYFAAAAILMAPYSDTSLKQTVSSVTIDVTTGVATVVWSQGYNGAVAHQVGSVYDLPSEFKAIAMGETVIVSEAEYSYQPLMGYFFENPFTFYREYFYMPRYGSAITVS